MAEYQVTLLGIPGVSMDGREIRFPYRKAEAVFYYLCVEKHTNRDELVALLWGSGDEGAGRKNLRQALFQIRRCLGEEAIILQGRNDLKLNQRAGIRTDWDEDDREFALCRERFLDFFYLRDCPEFERWVERKRELQAERCLGCIRGELKEAAGNRNALRVKALFEAWEYWRPWDEEMAVAGMKGYARIGRHDWGIELYQRYEKRIRGDLEETPSHRAEVLFRTLLRRREVSERRHRDERNAGQRFFGRMAEIQEIDERIFLFLSGELCRSVVIEGEVGVGKTALMEEIRRMDHGEGALEILSHCYGAESEVPLRAWRDFLKQVEALYSQGEISLSGECIRIVSGILTSPAEGRVSFKAGVPERVRETETENGILYLLKELSGQRKVILYFDSLQWMDSVSQRLLQRIMIELGNERVFLVAACRTEGREAVRELLLALSERTLIETLHLSCFSQEEVGKIVGEAIRGGEAWEPDAREIFMKTEGNPLALMDMLDAIKSGKEEGSSRIGMWLRMRLSRLSGFQKRTLEALSACGEGADLEELAVLTELKPMELVETLESLMDSFVQEEMRENTPLYRFRHQFHRDYVYRSLSMGKRQLWDRTREEFVRMRAEKRAEESGS